MCLDNNLISSAVLLWICLLVERDSSHIRTELFCRPACKNLNTGFLVGLNQRDRLRYYIFHYMECGRF